MYSKFLKDCVVKTSASLYEVYWKGRHNDSMLCVLDDKDKFVGIIGWSQINELDRVPPEIESAVAMDICNRNCYTFSSKDDLYPTAQIFYSNHPDINFVPVVDEDRNLLDVMTQTRAFWMSRYNTQQVPRLWYAKGIYEAAKTAAIAGIKHISVMEFGVATGGGLLTMEFHAHEVERVTGIKIDVYGFDSGEGLLFDESDQRNIAFRFCKGDYRMNKEDLMDKIRYEKMIFGDICDTTKDFFQKYHPAPIGFVSVDVDNYTPTAAILAMLANQDESLFLPRVQLYFDDLLSDFEFQGEIQAIKEFNQKYENLKISPERFPGDVLESRFVDVYDNRPTVYMGKDSVAYFMKKMKLLHRFNHPAYNYADGITYGLIRTSTLI